MPGKEIEVIGVAQGQVHVTRVRALDALGHPSSAARVEDGRKALRWIVQPRRWFSSGSALRQGQNVERRQVARNLSCPRVRMTTGCASLEHVSDQTRRARW